MRTMAEAAAGKSGGGEKKVELYQLKVTLQGSKPPIWRRLLIDENAMCSELADMILGAMGWHRTHLFQFEIGNRIIGDKKGDPYDTTDEDIDTTPIKRLFGGGRKSVRFTYDFGDNWTHQVKFEKVVPWDDDKEPGCIAGKRACPPEDCGGIGGYEELLEILKNPEHPEYQDRIEWLNDVGYENYDPEKFDISEVTACSIM